MKKIAITGTIGSGKSTVSRLFKEKGFPVFDCDRTAYELSLPNGSCYPKICASFNGIVQENGTIDRTKLAALVFDDDKARQKLEVILHPAILLEMEKKAAQSDGLFLAEVPTLFESGWEIYFDGVLLISVSEELRFQRLKRDRSMTVDEIKQRTAAQTADGIKRQKATWIIENNGTLAELKEKADAWLAARFSEEG